MIEDRAYLTIEYWPQGFSQEQRAVVLRQFLNLDPARAQALVRRRAPAIYARLALGRCARVAQELIAAGIPAVSVPGAAIAAHMNPWTARAVSLGADDRLTVERWRDGSDRFPAQSIILLTRAHCREIKRDGHPGDFGVQALHQLHGTVSADDWNQGPTARRGMRVVEALDIHTIEGPHWRFVGGRFTGTLPGMDGEPTTISRIDELAGVLSKLAGGREVDRGFETSRFLAEFAPDFGVGGDWRSAAGFGVYSAWRRYLALARQVA